MEIFIILLLALSFAADYFLGKELDKYQKDVEDLKLQVNELKVELDDLKRRKYPMSSTNNDVL